MDYPPKGATRIIFDEVCRRALTNERISISALQDATGYSNITVWRTLKRLRNDGLISYDGHYQVNGGDEMQLPGALRAIVNMVTLPPDEKWRRLSMALAANRLYNDGKKLRRLAHKIGGEFKERADRFLDQHGITELTTVWDEDEAARYQDTLDDLLKQAQAVIQ